MTPRIWSRHGSSLRLFRDEQDWQEQSAGDALLIAGRAHRADSWAGWVPASIWFPLHGSVTVEISGGTVRVESGSLLVVEHGTHVNVRVDRSGDEVGSVLLPRSLIAEVCELEFGHCDLESLVIPERIVGMPILVAALSRLVSLANCGAQSSIDLGTRVRAVVAQIALWQSHFEPEIARCPGRDEGYRRGFFLRLQRARNAIEFSCGAQSSLDHLARIAQLSHAHFLRTYRLVFGLTPHKYAIGVRFEHALDLLLRTRKPVKAIGMAVGVSNRTAFSRAFRDYHGVSPRDVRVRANVVKPAEESSTDDGGVSAAPHPHSSHPNGSGY